MHCYSYNTTPHQATGESPHFLMFGQEPRLPVDFLLGRIPQPREGSVHDWVLEHQTRLQVAFAGARKWFQVMADRRKALHDPHVKDEPLVEGQLVHLRDYGVRGRHKIQDLWSPVVYQVVRAPKEAGVVYTIAPVDDLMKVKNVLLSLLKSRVPTEIRAVDHDTPFCDPVVKIPLLAEEVEDVDMLAILQEQNQVAVEPELRVGARETVYSPQEQSADVTDPAPVNASGGDLLVSQAPLSEGLVSVDEPVGIHIYIYIYIFRV